ncbi:MAG TPA: glycerol acyltransferase [Myxococcales bacterium]|mgnify:CR=1 FL=1|nr:glycerol acyltransferase [Deltaproteobacteria bacterium]HAA54776.1 glycerol acyltransferase [Myxococcales bacterium]|tara:strand:+ start:10551 stop:12488 length:1938 start_codon:yes stop_codon:yes gene_type:complete
MSQANLLVQRRFWPFFWVSFLTAFNDNVFKQGLITYVTVVGLKILGMDIGLLGAASTIIIIFPYVAFSALAGQVNDKHSKSTVVRWVKFAEVVIMAIGLYGLLTKNFPLLLGVLFLTGLQSTFFGPAKYSFLPDVLDDDELVGGNALIELGTFLSILLGTIVGGMLVGLFGNENGPTAIAVAVMVISSLGFVLSLFVEKSPPTAPDLSVQLDPIRPNIELFKLSRLNNSVFLSILGISWFWYVGTALLALLPAYAKVIFGTNPYGLTYMTGLFCVGIGVGSLMCERASRQTLEIGLVPFGSLGMSVFLFVLFIVGVPKYRAPGVESLSLLSFVLAPKGIIISVSLLMIAISGGFFTVPMYTLMQMHSPDDKRSRVIASSNVISSFFMLASGGLVMVFTSQGLTITTQYLVLAAMNIAVAFYIYKVNAAFLWRFLVWMVTSVMYRYNVVGVENIPKEGAAVFVCNHPSFFDFMFVASASKRTPRFLMWYKFFEAPLMGWFFRDAKVIPIAPRSDDEALMNKAFDRVAEELEKGHIVCIFPEGGVTTDGKLQPFRPGIEKIIKRTPVPVIPMTLKGMWGSFFSRYYGKAMSKPFTRFRSNIELEIGEAIAPEDVTAQKLAEMVAEMGDFEVPPPAYPVSKEDSPKTS